MEHWCKRWPYRRMEKLQFFNLKWVLEIDRYNSPVIFIIPLKFSIPNLQFAFQSPVYNKMTDTVKHFFVGDWTLGSFRSSESPAIRPCSPESKYITVMLMPGVPVSRFQGLLDSGSGRDRETQAAHRQLRMKCGGWRCHGAPRDDNLHNAPPAGGLITPALMRFVYGTSIGTDPLSLERRCQTIFARICANCKAIRKCKAKFTL